MMEGTRLTGLWKNKDKNGKTYLSGSLGLARLLVLPNDFKKKDADPDYTVLLVPAEKKTGTRETAPREEDL